MSIFIVYGAYIGRRLYLNPYGFTCGTTTLHKLMTMTNKSANVIAFVS
jgi:hypothetical protein